MKKKKKLPLILGIVIGAIALVYFGGGLANYICNIKLREFIKTFDKVDYSDRENRAALSYDDAGHVVFSADDDFRIMQLSDIHIGGGIFSYKRDKKAIYEVITMLQEEKPDLVILGGDNTYALFSIGYNGGGTFNNKMVAKTLISLFEHEEVYFSTVFGNHDTEFIDYYDRQAIGEVYSDSQYNYSVFKSEFTDLDADTVPSVSNQFIILKDGQGNFRELILLMDTNAYIDTGFISSARGLYDTVHESQIDWAADEIKRLSKEAGLNDGEYLETLLYIHIPVGEYQTAYSELIEENVVDDITTYSSKEETGNTEFISGGWDEIVYYGGISNKDITPENQDMLIETLGTEMKSVKMVFCGHDHINNAVVKYKDVILSYNYSVDNIAYGNAISAVGAQRGCSVVNISEDNNVTLQHKNAYKDYNIDSEKFISVDTDAILYPARYRTYLK